MDKKTKYKRALNEPTQSDATLLLKVEDLIHIAMGPPDKNIINFKMIESVLFILARQMRLLDTKVELQVGELQSEAQNYISRIQQQPLELESSEETMATYDEADGGGKRKGKERSAAAGKERGGGTRSSPEGMEGGTGTRSGGGGRGREGGGGYEEAGVGGTKGMGGGGRAEYGVQDGAVPKQGSRRPSGTSLAVSEKRVGKDNVLVVGKSDKSFGGAGAGGRTRVGSIEVVTAKEFALLEDAVRALMDKASLPPAPTLPANKKLLSDIEKGRASLTDTMQAMQLGARVQAAEKAITNVAELLTSLASTGALPSDVAAQAAAIQGDVQAMKHDMKTMMGPGAGGPGGQWVGGPGGPGGPTGPGGQLIGGPGGPRGPTGPGGQWVGGPGGPGGPTSSGGLIGVPGGPRGPTGPGGQWVGGPGGPGGPTGTEGQWVGGPGGLGGHTGPKGQSVGGPGGPGGPTGPGGQWVGGPGGPGGQEGQMFGGPGGGFGGPGPDESAGYAGGPGQGQRRPLDPVSAKVQETKPQCITHADLDGAMARLRDDIVQKMEKITNSATVTAELAANAVRTLEEKIEIAVTLDQRVTSLQQMAKDYADQLKGFDSGLITQINSFQDQIATMRVDLQAGLTQLEAVNNNAETAAVLELTERYEGLANELDATLHSHQGLSTFQRQLTKELKSLVEAVEQMREQKADRDEVLDGLRDKADSLKLQGLLTEKEFEMHREQLELRIQACYDKFRKQDAVWMQVIDDFSELIETKAEMTQLQTLRDEAQYQLQDIHWKVQQLAKLLGDPKAAVLIRKLAKDGTCAVCRVPALMEPLEPIQPVALPASRPLPKESFDEKICLRTFNLKDIIGPEVSRDQRPHMCHRWTGGSHTMMGGPPGLGTVTREQAPPAEHPIPMKRYMGKGTDGKLYNFEEACLPCKECNPTPPVPSKEKIPGEADASPKYGDGSGDRGATSSRVTIVDPHTAARNVTIVDDSSIRQAVDTSELKDASQSKLGVRVSSMAPGDEGDEGDELFPPLHVRQSRLDHSAAAFEAEAAAHDIAVGQTIAGRGGVSKVQMSTPEDAEEGAEDAKEGAETGGEGGGTPDKQKEKRVSIKPPTQEAPPPAEEAAPEDAQKAHGDAPNPE